MRKPWLLLGFLLTANAVWGFDNLDKITMIEPGMKKQDVLEIIGQPDAVVSKSVTGQGKRAEVHRYTYQPPVTEAIPAKEPFIKPEFSRDAKNAATQESEGAQEMVVSQSYLVQYIGEVVQSVEKS